MPKNEKNYNSVNNSITDVTSAHETCAKLIAFIKELYPQLNQIKYRISKNGKHMSLRARYKRRTIHADGFDFEKTINCFARHLVRKLSLEKYYPTIEEMKERKPLEPFFIDLRCFVSDNTNIITG